MRAFVGSFLRGGLLAVGLALGGCGEPGPAPEILAELDDIARAPSRAVAYTSAIIGVGTLTPSDPDENVFTALSIRIEGETNGCARRTVGANQLDVHFESPTGGPCPLGTGIVDVKGDAKITLQRQGSVLDIISTIDLVVDDEPFTGTIVVSAPNGSEFDIASTVKLNQHQIRLLNYRSIPIDQGTVITTMGTSTDENGAMREIQYMSLAQRFYGCHPYGGTVRLRSGTVDRTLSYLNETPQSDTASLADALAEGGARTTIVTLPRAVGCSAAAN